MQTKKYLDRYKCPCCQIMFDGWFYGTLEQFEYIDKNMFFKFEFNCPNTNKKISMLESKALSYNVFWLVEQENILDKYKIFRNFYTPFVNLIIIYLYYPINMEPDFNSYLKEKIEELKENYILGWVYPSYLKKYLDNFRYYIDSEWILDDKIFEYCRGTVYSSMLAELNIINEQKKWFYCKLMSNYPTLYPCFEKLNSNLIDIEKLKLII